MKGLLATILIFLILAGLVVIAVVVCTSTPDEQPTVTDSNGVIYGQTAMVEIGDGLWYDSSTGIVYWWNGVLHMTQYSVSPSPYYAPNGLPYRYNPETNTFEEIENDWND